MGEKRTEACGRCGISSVVDATDSGKGDERDPLGEDRIELDEREARSAMRAQVAVGRLKRRLDEVATRLTYGR
ncbi:hypothetical protein SAMN06269185_3079 [Natronoarchaeum philippinense]|uniref:Uncharacterized protein n=1 Tax=Natronoarchaeum philippinense TaxID=558529 RepID=A0A285P8Z6_NATPI|nr:hypothetical protein [Natronoarchaeum philippinense]SNZ17673.1 hypothetical protein SAMN06269185_3079 [Natronoarchaeum philippinense]